MEAVRDLASADPWQESLERSLARRGQRPHSGPAEPSHRRSHPSPAEGRIDRPRAHRNRGRPRRRPLASRPRLLAVGSWGILAVTVIMITVGGLIDGHGAQASAGDPSARITHPHVTPLRLSPAGAALGSNQAAARPVGSCRPVATSSGYVNPLAGDTLIGERIDQGVDYAGTGIVSAIGAGKVTYVGTSATGWPGAFIEYRLLTGPDTGCFVYYAEGINPTAGLRPGQHVRAGQVLANIIPGWATGIELGWGAGTSTKTYAEKSGKWTSTDDANSVASAAGKSFSALITALGGPAGRIEG